MAIIRTIYKPLLLILLVIIGAIMAVLFLRNNMPPQSLASRLTRLWHSLSISILGVELTISGKAENGNVLFVPNHISWLDISILGALLPVHFLSKSEIKSWPFIGLLATRTGTLYIERGYHHATVKANSDMQQVLQKNHNVVLFAEGTTTDGTLRKFHGRLMQSAIDAESLVQPVAIFYPDESGQAINRKILYINEMHFLKSAFTIFSQKKIRAKIYYLAPISAKGKTRNELAKYCQECVQEAINNK